MARQPVTMLEAAIRLMIIYALRGLALVGVQLDLRVLPLIESRAHGPRKLRFRW